MLCLQIPATNEITSLSCAKDPISGFRAIPATDRQDLHQPAVYIGRTQPHAYNHLPARSFEVLMEPLSGEEHRRQLELRRKWEKQQRAAAKRKRDEEDDDDEDDDPGDRSGKRKKDDDPDYQPSKKQLKKADQRGDK